MKMHNISLCYLAHLHNITVMIIIRIIPQKNLPVNTNFIAILQVKWSASGV
jgi:hypothetical protein